MGSYFLDDGSPTSPSSCGSSESDDSERLVIAEKSEDLGDPQASGSSQGNTEGRRYTYEEYKKICVGEFILNTLTYHKLKQLMALYHTEISEKSILYRRRCKSSWKSAKAMAKTLFMFHLMFEEIKENITFTTIYYQRMSDLISIYIDFEIKASEVSAENVVILSSRITSLMEKCLDRKRSYVLDTLLKSHNICNRFQEISTLLISRVVRGLPSTKHSEQAFIRSMLVFKLWIQLAKEVEERKKILKLASHLAKPPDELIKKPCKLAKDILPCNFQKCYIDLTTYIIGTPWPLHKKIKTFLERTRIVESCLSNESVLNSSDTSEGQKNEEIEDVKALKEIQSGLQKIILLEKKNKQIITKLKNNHYKYAPVEELCERTPFFLDHLKMSKKDAITQAEEFAICHAKGIYDYFSELIKQLVNIANDEVVQNQAREIELQQDKILSEISIADLPNNIRNAEFSQESIPNEATNLLNFDSAPAVKEKTIMSVSNTNANIQNNDVAVLEVNRKGKKNNSKKNVEDEISTISVRPAASISNNFDNVSSKAIADWHTPEVHCQSKVSTYNPFSPSYKMQMTSGILNKRLTEINQTDPEFPSLTSTLPLPPETLSGINAEQPNQYADLVRSTDSLLPTNTSLPHTRSNHYPGPNLTNGSPSTLLNRRAILRSSFVNDSDPGCREDNLFVRDTTIKYYPPPLSKNNSNLGPFNQVQGMNSVVCLKDQNYPMQQPHPMLFNQYNNRPHYSQANDSFSFYDDDTIANSGPRIMGSQTECQNLADPHSLMANSVRPQYPLPFNLPAGNNDEPTPHTNQTRRRGRGSRNTSTTQRSYRKQSPNTPANIAVNTNPTSDNPTLQSWPNIPTQEHYNSFRNIDCNYVPNSSSQFILRPPVPTHNFIQNDPKLTFIRLPPYSSIRKKNNGFDPGLPIAGSPSNNLPVNTNNCFPATNAPIAMPVNSSQPFSTVFNQFGLPVINTQPSLPPINVSLCGPGISASTSFSVPRTQDNISEVMRSNNSYRTYVQASMFAPLELYQKLLNIGFHKVICKLTHKNDFGFLEYNFKKMPIPLHPFKDALTCIEKINSNNNATDTVDGIILLLSQTNENFVNEKNMFPPQLLRVNNNDVNKGKFNIGQEQRKRHEVTLNNDHLTFVYQEKIRNFYSECNDLSQDGFMVKSDLQTRCYCLQCCANRILLDMNYIILREFRNYQMFQASVHSKENEKNQHLKMAGTSKRSFEKSAEERGSPLPLKKRITSPPNEVRSMKDSEVSYPSTPMISIAELELLKDISTNMMEHKADSGNGNSSTPSTIPNSMIESRSSEISKNIFANKPVAEAATYHTVESNESRIKSANNNDNLLHGKTRQNLSSSEKLIQSSVAIKPRKLQVNSASKRSLGRPRKSTKKDGQK